MYAFCLNESSEQVKEPVFSILPENNEGIRENFNGQAIYPLVSLEIRTQQLKLEGEIIQSRIVSRRILVAKGVVESRLLPDDFLFFNTNIENNQRVKVKQFVGTVTYNETNREEQLYSSCDGLMKEILPQGFYGFETIFFVIYCDLKKSNMDSYLGYSIIPHTEMETIFDNNNDTLVKKETIARKNRLNDSDIKFKLSEKQRKLAFKQKVPLKHSNAFEHQEGIPEYQLDKSQLSSICDHVKDSTLPDSRENSGVPMKRVEFLYKRCIPSKKRIVDSSLTMKLKAYRKSLEYLKQSVANITDFSRTGNAKIEDEERQDFDKQGTKATNLSSLYIEYKIWVLLTVFALILILISVRNRVFRYSTNIV